jgi:hypothetical protein
MPGSFADPAVEAAWLAEVSAHRSFHDAVVYAFCALIHLVELVRIMPRELLRTPLQILHVRPRRCLACPAHRVEPVGCLVLTATARHPALAHAQILLLLLVLPAVVLLRRSWYVRHRELVVTAVRLATAAAAPLWLLRDTSATAGACMLRAAAA